LLQERRLTFPRLWESQQAAQKRFDEWEPKTREEAQQRWKEMQDTPDHLALLRVYKRAGVEPIKLAKFVSISPRQLL
jgi:small subunit ribosomal protein S10